MYNFQANGGDRESSGLDELFDSLVNHLTLSHGAFLQHWDRLIDLESKVKHHGYILKIFIPFIRIFGLTYIRLLTQAGKRQIPDSSDQTPDCSSLSSFLLDISRECSVDDSSRNRRYVYHFTNKNIRSEEGNGRKNITDCGLRCGDYVVCIVLCPLFYYASSILHDQYIEHTVSTNASFSAVSCALSFASQVFGLMISC